MLVLGINTYFHDTSAALMMDGKLLAFVEEERFTGNKHQTGFPDNAINWCLSECNIQPKDLDLIVADDPRLGYYSDVNMKPITDILKKVPNYRKEIKLLCDNVANLVIDYAKKHNVRYEFMEHHMAHLATAYYGSGLDSALVLSVDNRGESHSIYLAEGKDGELFLIDKIPLPTSLGAFYSAITAFLGYKINDGEGTVMGLSTYGQPSYLDFFNSYLEEWPGGFRIIPELCFNELSYPDFPKIETNPIIQKFGSPRSYRYDPRDGIDEDIAASAQIFLENILEKYIQYYLKEYNHKRLVIAGGVGLNSKANGHLYKALNLEDLYVFPASNDAGIAIGFCMLACKESGYNINSIDEEIYFGPEYSDSYIANFLYDQNIQCTTPSIDELTELLVEDKIIGIFRGRMEGGPRALGNRSLLVNPNKLENKNRMNDQIKFREEWRPFAPSILSDYAYKYTNNIKARFMTITFEGCFPELIAASHVDGSIRVQNVSYKSNKFYYNLIENFRQQTGIPGLLNTSFNVKGSPIVRTPGQAVDMFKETGMDCLYIGDKLLIK